LALAAPRAERKILVEVDIPDMAGQWITIEEIIHTLREADAPISQGKPFDEACRWLTVIDKTCN
jgi:hypothetical protein